MLASRLIPVLQLQGAGLVKTTRFRSPRYVGDPRNTVRIFNEKGVDELLLLDFDASRGKRQPQVELLREIVTEAFMPVTYGGGVQSVGEAEAILSIGVEKIIVGTAAFERPSLVTDLVSALGSSSVVVSVDYLRTPITRKHVVTIRGGQRRTGIDPVAWAIEMAARGAGELVVHSVARDGCMCGYDIPLIASVSAAVAIPVVACGGAGQYSDLRQALEAGASAAAAGSLFVFRGPHRAVLINFPRHDERQEILGF